MPALCVQIPQVWTVSGIVAERPKTAGLQGKPMSSKPVVLSDGPNGVEWGSGNLKGNMEGGYLVWRNRQGEATFEGPKWDRTVKDSPRVFPNETPVRGTPLRDQRG